MALVEVPQTDATLFVARACTGALAGPSPISSAGSCTSPPPPTTASTQPAVTAATSRSARFAALVPGGRSNQARTSLNLGPRGVASAPATSWGRSRPDRAADLRHYGVDDVGEGDLGALSARPVLDLDDALRQPLADHDDRRDAEQLGVLELHTRRHLRPVVVHHRQALALQRRGQPFGLGEHGLVLAGGDQVDVGR